MRFVRFKVPSIMGAAALAATFMSAGVMNAAAAPIGTCSGGSVVPGTYQSLTIAGFCQLNAGSVTVQRNVVVQPGATLIAAFGGWNLNVGRNVMVGSNANLVLGCEPVAFPCPNSPTSGRTWDWIGGNLVGQGAREMIVHATGIGGEIAQTGGGGGLFCDFSSQSSLFFSTYEDNVVWGDATVAGLKTCWLGFIRNTVHGSVNLNNNSTADEDGNEFVGNTVSFNLSCFNNNPAAQFGDSGGAPNVVGGTTRGQCLALI